MGARRLGGDPRTGLADHDIVAVLPSIQRVVKGMRVPASDQPDVIQETALRLLRNRDRLATATLRRYAEVTARNTAIAMRRKREDGREMPSGLLQMPSPERAEDPVHSVLDVEEAAAVRAALQDLSAIERDSLAYLEGGPSSSPYAGSSRSVAMRRMRVRSRLRLFTTLRFRRLRLPTARCEAVLLAVSTRDRRRERTIMAAEHVLYCPTCAKLAPVIARRDRRLLGLATLPGLALLRRWWHGSGTATRLTTIGTASVAIAVGAALLLAVPAHPPPPSFHPINLVGGAGHSPRSIPNVLGQPHQLGVVLFTSGSAGLDSAAKAVVRNAVNDLMREHARSISVVGYTDPVGRLLLNRTLARQRAWAVARYLRALAGPRILVHVYGGGIAPREQAPPGLSRGTYARRTVIF